MRRHFLFHSIFQKALHEDALKLRSRLKELVVNCGDSPLHSAHHRRASIPTSSQTVAERGDSISFPGRPRLHRGCAIAHEARKGYRKQAVKELWAQGVNRSRHAMVDSATLQEAWLSCSPPLAKGIISRTSP